VAENQVGPLGPLSLGPLENLAEPVLATLCISLSLLDEPASDK